MKIRRLAGAALAGLMVTSNLTTMASADPAQPPNVADYQITVGATAVCNGRTGEWNVLWTTIPLHEPFAVQSPADPSGNGTVRNATKSLIPLSFSNGFSVTVPGSSRSTGLRLDLTTTTGSLVRLDRTFDLQDTCTLETPPPCDATKPQDSSFTTDGAQARLVTTGNCALAYAELTVGIPMGTDDSYAYSASRGPQLEGTTKVVAVADLPPCSWTVRVADVTDPVGAGKRYTGGSGSCASTSETARSLCDGSIELTFSSDSTTAIPVTYKYIRGSAGSKTQTYEYRTINPGESVSIILPDTPYTATSHWPNSSSDTIHWQQPAACVAELGANQGNLTFWKSASTSPTSWTRISPMPNCKDSATAKIDQVAIASTWALNQTHLLFTDPSGAISHNLRYSDGVCTGSTHVAGKDGTAFQAKGIAAAAMPDGSLQLVAIGLDSMIYHNIRYANGTWQGFARLGDITGSSVAIANTDDGSTQVLVTDQDNTVQHNIRYADGSWQGFDSTGFEATKTAITGMDDGSTQILAIGMNGFVNHNIRFADGSWQGFTPVSGYGGSPEFASDSIAIARDYSGTSYSYFTGLDHNIYYTTRQQNGYWPAIRHVDAYQVRNIAADGYCQILASR